MAAPAPFATLPDEILHQILSFLDVPDLAARASLVCRRFARHAADPSLWKDMDLDSRWMDLTKAETLIDRCTHLERLVLKNWRSKDPTSLAERALEHCPVLRTLRICYDSHCGLTKCGVVGQEETEEEKEERRRRREAEKEAYVSPTEEQKKLWRQQEEVEEAAGKERQMSLMKTIGKYNKSLRELDWDGALHPDVVRENVGCLRHLTHLGMSLTAYPHELAINAIGGVCDKLKSFNLDGGYGGCNDYEEDDELNQFLDGARDTLEDLVLYCGYAFTDASMKNIVKCEKMQHLYLSNAGMEGDSVKSFIQLLPRLKSLKIPFWFESDDRLRDLVKSEHLIDAFHQRQSLLESLELNGRQEVDDRGLEAIAGGCPRLKDLSITGCRSVTDQGLERILEKCGELAKLNVRGIQGLTAEPFTNAATARGTSFCLRELLCNANQADMMELEEIVPVLKVEPEPERYWYTIGS